MKNSRKKKLNPLNTDPFSNMISRPNKNPLLKPVFVNNRSSLTVTRSAGALYEEVKLPPILSPRDRYAQQRLDRSSVRTPTFKPLSKFIIQPIQRRVKPSTEKEISFGDTDEGAVGLTNLINRYKH